MADLSDEGQDLCCKVGEDKNDAQRLAAIYDMKKRNKSSRLTKDKPMKAKCHRQKKSNQNQIKYERNINSVVNVSDVTLSEGEVSLLSRGLSFCPKPSRINQFQLREDIKRFSMRVRLTEFFTTQKKRMKVQ